MDLFPIDSNDDYFAEVGGILRDVSVRQVAGDSMYCCTSQQVDELRDLQYRTMLTRSPMHRSLSQAQEYAHRTVPLLMGDMLINARTNNRTYPVDPTLYTVPTTPIMLSPKEATDLYATGGLPATIIDKKTEGLTMNGLTFTASTQDFWTADKILQLEDAAQETGFNDHGTDALTDAFLYGGGFCYPIFENDTISTLAHPIPVASGSQKIRRWTSVDRWSITAVPSLIVTTEDYINPRTYFIAATSTVVSTRRGCIFRPTYLPYWAVLYNVGWCPSDFCSWLDAYYAYQTTMQSVPIMAQQMSLLLYKLPLDALNATIGPDNVKKLMEINEEKMAEWSVTSPKAVNMVGEVEVVNRTYSGFDNFIGSMKNNLAAHCGIPEPSLWHTPNKGFADNTNESILKSSESMQLIGKRVERCLAPARDALIIHCFGLNSEEYERRNTLKATYDKPVVQTEKDKAEIGARFAATVNSLAQAQVSPDESIKIAKTFFPTLKISDDELSGIRKDFDDAIKREEEAQKNQLQAQRQRMKGGAKGTGPSLASQGNNARIGHFSR